MQEAIEAGELVIAALLLWLAAAVIGCGLAVAGVVYAGHRYGWWTALHRAARRAWQALYGLLALWHARLNTPETP